MQVISSQVIWRVSRLKEHLGIEALPVAWTMYALKGSTNRTNRETGRRSSMIEESSAKLFKKFSRTSHSGQMASFYTHVPDHVGGRVLTSEKYKVPSNFTSCGMQLSSHSIWSMFRRAQHPFCIHLGIYEFCYMHSNCHTVCCCVTCPMTPNVT